MRLDDSLNPTRNGPQQGEPGAEPKVSNTRHGGATRTAQSTAAGNIAPSGGYVGRPPMLVNVALAHAAKGYYVHPLREGGKAPILRDWENQATTDPTKIRQWWAEDPRANVGIATGPTGLIAVDFDPKNNPDAYQAWADSEPGRATPAPQQTTNTPSGGQHRLWRASSGGVPNRVGLVPGVDVRSQGGNLVAPGSVLVGAGGSRRPWSAPGGGWELPSVASLPEAPRGVAELLSRPARERHAAPVGVSGQEAAFAREITKVATAPTGTRNQRLNEAAHNLGQLVGPTLSEDLVRTTLTEAAIAAKLDPEEVARTVESGLAAGMARPRKLANAPHAGASLVLTRASDIEIEPVYWLWDGRLALGTLGVLAGREGLGKSTLAYWLASQVTRGRLPGEFNRQPKSVLVCATEDSWSHTIVPRLTAAGADLDQVFQVEMRDDGLPMGLSLPRDVNAVADAARQVDAALMVLDPLMSRLSGTLDTHKDAEVRRALEPLVAMADSTRMAVLGLMHHNKSDSGDLSRSLMGSRAFSAVARSVHSVIQDGSDESGRSRLFGTWKNNLGRDDLPSLAFTIEGVKIDHPGREVHTSRIVWGDEVSVSIQEMQRRATEQQRPKSQTELAGEWLTAYLEGQPGLQCDGEQVRRAAAQAGFPESTLKTAKTRCGVQSTRAGVGKKGSVWYLPGAEVQGVLP